jgi:ribosome biogenesis GTP-binding protein YsxC/EngB
MMTEELPRRVKSKKEEARMQAKLREQWHLRQKPEEEKTGKRSALKQFMSIPVKKELVDHIYSFGLVRLPRFKKDPTEQDAILEYEIPRMDPETFEDAILEDVLAEDEEQLEPLPLQKIPKREPKLKFPPPKGNPVIDMQMKQREMKTINYRTHKVKPDMLCDECTNWVFEHKMRLVGVATDMPSLTKILQNDSRGIHLPHIAFAGRSNVGKSSLVNSITGKNVMKTSDRPGETREITFYRVGSTLTVVDLPGYGFAYANDKTKEQWNNLMKNYFTTCRDKLKVIYLLLDSRHGIKHNDREMIKFLEQHNAPYQIVFTKTDLVFVDELARRMHLVQEEMKELTGKEPELPMLCISSESKSGIAFMKQEIVHKHANFIVEHWKKNIKKNVVMYL